MDAGVLFQELGRGPVPGPYFSSSILGATLLMEGGTESQKQSMLPAIARGEETLALAVTEPDYGWEPHRVKMAATPQNGGFRLSGVKLFVNDACTASHIICAARTADCDDPSEGVSLFLVDARSPGLSVRNLPGFLGWVWGGEVRLGGGTPLSSAGGGDRPGLECATRRDEEGQSYPVRL